MRVAVTLQLPVAPVLRMGAALQDITAQKVLQLNSHVQKEPILVCPEWKARKIVLHAHQGCIVSQGLLNQLEIAQGVTTVLVEPPPAWLHQLMKPVVPVREVNIARLVQPCLNHAQPERIMICLVGKAALHVSQGIIAH